MEHGKIAETKVVRKEATPPVPKKRPPVPVIVKEDRSGTKIIYVANSRNRVAAIFICAFFGVLGGHQFYIGNTLLGATYLLAPIIACAIGLWNYLSSGNFGFGDLKGWLFLGPICVVFVLVGCIVDFFTLLAMGDDDFDERYNRNLYKTMKRMA